MEGKDMTLDVLGTAYHVRYSDYDADPFFKLHSCDGYCDGVSKVIAVCNIKTYPNYEDETEQNCRIIEKATLRHEIVHAFLNESGIQESGLQYSGSWARNEEMVDWIALQFPKMLKTFQIADAL